MYDRLEHIPRFNLIYNLVFLSIGFLTMIRLVPRFFYFNQFKKKQNRKRNIIIGKEIDCYRFIKFNENQSDIEIVGLFVLDNNLSGTLRYKYIRKFKESTFLNSKKKIQIDQKDALTTYIPKNDLRDLF